MHWSDHNQSAIAELRNGDLEKAAIYARLTEAAARVAEAAAKVTGT